MAHASLPPVSVISSAASVAMVSDSDKDRGRVQLGGIGTQDPLLEAFNDACPGYAYGEMPELIVEDLLGVSVPQDAGAVWYSDSDGESYDLLVDGSPQEEIRLVRAHRRVFETREETQVNEMMAITQLAIEFGYFEHVRSGAAFQVISMLWMIEMTDGFTSANSIIKFPMGIVRNTSAAKQFMSLLVEQEVSGFGDVPPVECHPACYCECSVVRSLTHRGCALAAQACILAALARSLWVNVPVCGATCTVFGPAGYIPCLLSCLAGNTVRAWGPAIAACLALQASCRTLGNLAFDQCETVCWELGYPR